MNRKLVLTVICVAGALSAQTVTNQNEHDHQKAEVTKTEKFSLPEAGTLHVQNSLGDLTIEGWDQPGVEITTTKSTQAFVSAKDRENELKGLEKVHVSAKLNGDELLVTTEFQHHKAFPWIWPLSDTNNFDISYHISVPRHARIIVKHVAGEVHVADITGNIQVTAQQGLISLSLPGDAPGAIEAKSEIGNVYSDFPAKETGHPWVFGNSFVESPAAAGQKVKLRIGFGDIFIRKPFEAPAAAAAPAPK